LRTPQLVGLSEDKKTLFREKKMNAVLFALALTVFVSCLLVTAQYPLVNFQTFEMSKCPVRYPPFFFFSYSFIFQYCAAWKQHFNDVVMKAEGVPDILNLTEYFVAYYYGGDFSCLHGIKFLHPVRNLIGLDR
jgi:hypothetical protein